jgi:hypothetical protein
VSDPLPGELPDLLRTLEANARQADDLATQVAGNVTALEAWLNRLPFKTKARVWGDLPARPGRPADPELRFGLAFDRHEEQGAWALFVQTGKPAGEGIMEGGRIMEVRGHRLLREAPLPAKAAAVQLFPALLKEIDAHQQAMLAGLQEHRRRSERWLTG